MVTICYKYKKILQNWCFCKLLAFTSEAHITKIINTCRNNCHFFSELTRKILLKAIVIFPKKLLNFYKEFIGK